MWSFFVYVKGLKAQITCIFKGPQIFEGFLKVPWRTINLDFWRVLKVHELGFFKKFYKNKKSEFFFFDFFKDNNRWLKGQKLEFLKKFSKFLKRPNNFDLKKVKIP